MRPIYIISYLPDEESLNSAKLKEKRKRINHAQLEWLISYDFCPIHVFSQNYEDGDYFDHPKVQYHDIETINIVWARNNVLEHFYKSDYPWAYFADDDMILYDHAMGGKVFDKIEEEFGHLSEIDCFSFINPVDQPFKKEFNEGKYNYLKQLVFQRKVHFPTQFYFMRNFKDLEYFDDNFFRPRVLGGEDNDFFIRQTAKGRGVYVCWNAVLKSLAPITASTWSTDDRGEKAKLIREKLYEKHHNIGVDLKNGRLYTKDVTKANKPKTIVAPPETTSLDELFN